MTAVKTCPKCGATSGDDWSQCGGSCPMPGSPHYADRIDAAGTEAWAQGKWDLPRYTHRAVDAINQLRRSHVTFRPGDKGPKTIKFQLKKEATVKRLEDIVTIGSQTMRETFRVEGLALRDELLGCNPLPEYLCEGDLSLVTRHGVTEVPSVLTEMARRSHHFEVSVLGHKFYAMPQSLTTSIRNSEWRAEMTCRLRPA